MDMLLSDGVVLNIHNAQCLLGQTNTVKPHID